MIITAEHVPSVYRLKLVLHYLQIFAGSHYLQFKVAQVSHSRDYSLAKVSIGQNFINLKLINIHVKSFI